MRASAKRRTYVAINWTGSPQTVRRPTPMRDLLSGSTASAVTLNRYGVAVVAHWAVARRT